MSILNHANPSSSKPEYGYQPPVPFSKLLETSKVDSASKKTFTQFNINEEKPNTLNQNTSSTPKLPKSVMLSEGKNGFLEDPKQTLDKPRKYTKIDNPDPCQDTVIPGSTQDLLRRGKTFLDEPIKDTPEGSFYIKAFITALIKGIIALSFIIGLCVAAKELKNITIIKLSKNL